MGPPTSEGWLVSAPDSGPCCPLRVCPFPMAPSLLTLLPWPRTLAPGGSEGTVLGSLPGKVWTDPSGPLTLPADNQAAGRNSGEGLAGPSSQADCREGLRAPGPRESLRALATPPRRQQGLQRELAFWGHQPPWSSWDCACLNPGGLQSQPPSRAKVPSEQPLSLPTRCRHLACDVTGSPSALPASFPGAGISPGSLLGPGGTAAPGLRGSPVGTVQQGPSPVSSCRRGRWAQGHAAGWGCTCPARALLGRQG